VLCEFSVGHLIAGVIQIYWSEECMEHKAIDHEISQILKESTALHKKGESKNAVELLKKVILMFNKSSLLYGVQNYTKVIPYFQKAGLYSELDPYVKNVLLKEIKNGIERGLSHRVESVRLMHTYQYYSAVYDKVALAAKREKRSDDHALFKGKSDQFFTLYEMIESKAKVENLQQEFDEVVGAFGADSNSWPDVFQKRFSQLLR